MSRGIAIGLPTVAAVLAPTVVASAYFFVLGGVSREILIIALWVLVVAAAHVLLLGLPIYALLYRLNRVHWWSLTAFGFVAGSVPFGAFSWPLWNASPGASSQENGVWTMIDGIPTVDGWIQFGKGLIWFGALGAIGAFSFWFARERMRSNKSLERTRGR
jgi:hypothetical protein